MTKCEILFLCTITLTIRANSFKNHFVAGNNEAVAVFDFLLHIGNIVHIRIINSSALRANGVIMIAAVTVKAVGSVGDFDFLYFACFAQALQIAVDGCSADGGMLFNNCFVNLVRGRVTPELLNGIQNQSALNCFSYNHHRTS